MGNICDQDAVRIYKNSNNRNSMKNIQLTPYSKRLLSYYIFHHKIEEALDKNKRNIYKYQNKNDPNVKNESQKFYFIEKDWIEQWRASAVYNSTKEELDKYYSSGNLRESNQLRCICQKLLDKTNIEEFNETFPSSEKTYNKFIRNNKLQIEDFDCLVDEGTYNLFEKYAPSYFLRKTYYIKGIILDHLVILFIKEFLTVKFLYIGKVNAELIQLSANCLEKDPKTGNFNQSNSESKYETFKEYLKGQNDSQIINLFTSNQIENKEEISIPVYPYSINIRNENLSNENLNQIILANKVINFKNLTKFRLIGLDNVGATCYMNATLQCFLNVKPLTEYLLNEQLFYKIYKNKGSFTLSRAYCNLLEKVWLDDTITKHYAPREFKRVISAKNPLFEGINANDSKDLINFLLEEMNIELQQLNETNQIDCNNNMPIVNQMNMQLTLENFRSDFAKKNNSVIAHNFFFILETNSFCLGCKSLRYNFQALFLLEFPLESVYKYNVSQNIPSINNKGKKFVDIFSCLKHYKLPSTFTGDNQLYCNTCNSLQDAISTNLIFSLPPVLIFILNRGKGKAFDCDVDFPLDLNLQKYVEYQKSIFNYKLRGVISHLGESGMGGHFIAYCRHRIDDKWYLYNDSTVTLCKNQNSDFMVGTAYILFYESIENKYNAIFDKKIDINCIKKNTKDGYMYMNINGSAANNMIMNSNPGMSNCNEMINGNNMNNNMIRNSFNPFQNNNFQNNPQMNNGFNNFNDMNINNMNNMFGQNLSNFNNMNGMNNNMNNNMNVMNNNMNGMNNNMNNNMNAMNNNMNGMNNNMNNNMDVMNNNMNAMNNNNMNGMINNNTNTMNNNMNVMNNNINAMNNNIRSGMNNSINAMNNNMNATNNNVNFMNSNINLMNNNMIMNNNMNFMNNNINTMNNDMNGMNNNMNGMNNNINTMNNNMNGMNNNMNTINNNMNGINNNINTINNNMNGMNNNINTMNNNIRSGANNNNWNNMNQLTNNNMNQRSPY